MLAHKVTWDVRRGVFLKVGGGDEGRVESGLEEWMYVMYVANEV